MGVNNRFLEFSLSKFVLNIDSLSFCILYIIRFFCAAVVHSFQYSSTSYISILILVKSAAEFVHQEKFHWANAGWDAKHDCDDHHNTDVKIPNISSDVMDAVTDFRCTVRLLAASLRAVKTTLETNMLGDIKLQLINPKVGSFLIFCCWQGLVTILPIPRPTIKNREFLFNFPVQIGFIWWWEVFQ